MSVSLKRGLVAAALTGLLAVSAITPAAIASANELPVEDATTIVVDESTSEEVQAGEAAPEEVVPEETVPEETVPEETVPEETVPEETAPEEVVPEDVVPDDGALDESDPDAEPVAEETPAARNELAPTPTATSTNDPDPNRLDPGEVLEVTYDVAGARYVYVNAVGEGLEVTVSLPGGGGTREVTDFGTYHYSVLVWMGMPDGVWTLRIRNTGTETVTPTYGLTYSTASASLQLSSSVGAPGLNLHVAPVINGVTSTDYIVHSEVTGPDGATYDHVLPQEAAGTTSYSYTYRDLPNGVYLARVWLVVDGVTYEETRTVRVHELETEPPVVSAETVPAAPNAAGWFAQSVRLTLRGTDTGSGIHQLFYTLDGAPEEAAPASYALNVTGDGEHTVTYRGMDAQRNYSDWVERSINIDSTKPTVSLYGPVEGARYDIDEEVFAEYQCGDATSGIADCVGDRADMSRIDTSVRGDFTFTVVATDNAGNVTREVRHYSVGPEDTTDPVVEAELPAEPASGWYAGPVTVQLSASDDDTGVARLHWEYQTESGTVVEEREAETAEFTLDVTGEFQVTYWAQDAAGNRSEGRTLNLQIDVDRPEIEIVEPQGEYPSILPNGHYAQNEVVNVDFTCTDIGSGVDGCVGTTDAGVRLPTTTPGTHEFRVVATDLAGNRTESIVEYTVDAAPVVVAENPGAPVNTPRLAQTGSELLIPGIALVAVLLAAGAMLLASRRLGGR